MYVYWTGLHMPLSMNPEPQSHVILNLTATPAYHDWRTPPEIQQARANGHTQGGAIREARVRKVGLGARLRCVQTQGLESRFGMTLIPC